MSRPLILVFVLLALVGTACTSEGLPNSYTDQDGRAQRQFVDACEASLVDSDEPDPGGFCECAFYTVGAELTYDQFVELDERLKDDPEFLSNSERQLLESVSLPCAFGPDDLNVTTSG